MKTNDQIIDTYPGAKAIFIQNGLLEIVKEMLDEARIDEMKIPPPEIKLHPYTLRRNGKH